MDADVIAAVCVSAAAFCILAFLLLRFSAFPGLRTGTFCAIVLLSYPVAVGLSVVLIRLRLHFNDFPSSVGATCLGTILLTVPPIAVWGGFRFARLARRGASQAWWALAVMLVLSVVYVAFRFFAIPEKELDFAWYQTQRATAEFLPRSTVPSAVIARAEIDTFAAPITSYWRLSYEAAWRDSSGRAYLRLTADYHTSVVYCWLPRERKILWKALDSRSA